MPAGKAKNSSRRNWLSDKAGQLSIFVQAQAEPNRYFPASPLCWDGESSSAVTKMG